MSTTEDAPRRDEDIPDWVNNPPESSPEFCDHLDPHPVYRRRGYSCGASEHQKSPQREDSDLKRFGYLLLGTALMFVGFGLHNKIACPQDPNALFGSACEWELLLWQSPPILGSFVFIYLALRD